MQAEVSTDTGAILIGAITIALFGESFIGELLLTAGGLQLTATITFTTMASITATRKTNTG